MTKKGAFKKKETPPVSQPATIEKPANVASKDAVSLGDHIKNNLTKTSIVISILSLFTSIGAIVNTCQSERNNQERFIMLNEGRLQLSPKIILTRPDSTQLEASPALNKDDLFIGLINFQCVVKNVGKLTVSAKDSTVELTINNILIPGGRVPDSRSVLIAPDEEVLFPNQLTLPNLKQFRYQDLEKARIVAHVIINYNDRAKRKKTVDRTWEITFAKGAVAIRLLGFEKSL